MKNNPLVILSIIGIRRIWHGKIGRTYNKKRFIICRFYPSCSNYAIMALEKYGFFKGWALTINRLSRCNPRNTDSCIDFP
ncbi:membrane protein insertion efficiency factor YidD [uncultured Methanospirillum sp.]|uniref:membrane protein insertion efficiency factor YidD n=1 Tax=uncultured Methanospirillum sp. TaxID=262503 RepID=UPI00374A2C1A